ncbi:MAG TPA: hypothetical protein PKZ76_17570 [Xanthomonadaceae bacterium]|nr:hypothetical protein [Xanthomonadaceae bacterium]
MQAQLKTGAERVRFIEVGRSITAYVDGNYVGEATGAEERVHGRVRVVWSVETRQHGDKGRGYNKAAARRRLKELVFGSV